MRRTTGLQAGAAALALLLAGCGSSDKAKDTAATSSSAPKQSVAAGASGLQGQYEQVVRTVLPSIVQIETDQGEGSGVVYDGKGDIVTNAHVVAGAKSFQVTPASGGKALTGTLVGAFNADDLAVVKVDPAGLGPAASATRPSSRSARS